MIVALLVLLFCCKIYPLKYNDDLYILTYIYIYDLYMTYIYCGEVRDASDYTCVPQHKTNCASLASVQHQLITNVKVEWVSNQHYSNEWPA